MHKSSLYKRLYKLEVNDLEKLKEIADDIIINKMLNQIINEEEESKNERKFFF